MWMLHGQYALRMPSPVHAWSPSQDNEEGRGVSLLRFQVTHLDTSCYHCLKGVSTW